MARQISSAHPSEGIPLSPDTVQTLLIASSSGQAVDWPSTDNKPDIVRVTALTTLGAQMAAFVNFESTKAAVPTSGQSTLGSSAIGVVFGQGAFQVPRQSTGWSVASLSSGYVIVEQWHR